MKQALTFLMLTIVIITNAQTTITAKLAFNNIGDDYNVKVVLNPIDNNVKSRILPGMTVSLLYTDSAQLNGTEVSGKMRIINWNCKYNGYQTADSIHFVLTNTSTGAVIGQLVGSKKQSINYTIKETVNEMMGITHKYIYDTLLLYTPEWIGYEKELRQLSGFLQDDLELFALANRNASKLSFTHYNMNKMSDATWKSYFEDAYDSETPANLKEIDPQTALLTIYSFGGNGKSLEKYMEQVIEKKYSNLILDLRQNSGGGAGAALAISKYFSKQSKAAGALLTNKWFLNHKGIPTEKDYKQFAVFSSGSTNDLIKLFATEEGIILKANKSKSIYKGQLHILTSGKTASTCEPFVYALQYFKRATLIGAKTAGAMLSKIPFEMKNGFKLYLPVADYYTIDGRRLDKNGVEPDVRTTAALALEKSLEILKENK